MTELIWLISVGTSPSLLTEKDSLRAGRELLFKNTRPHDSSSPSHSSLPTFSF